MKVHVLIVRSTITKGMTRGSFCLVNTVSIHILCKISLRSYDPYQACVKSEPKAMLDKIEYCSILMESLYSKTNATADLYTEHLYLDARVANFCFVFLVSLFACFIF